MNIIPRSLDQGRKPSLLTALFAGFTCLSSLSFHVTADENHSLASQYSEEIDALHIAQQLDDTPIDFTALHTYDELVNALYHIEAQSNGAVDVGPLIRNTTGTGEFDDGLIDIDTPQFVGTSLRQAIINTVANDNVPTLGNTDPDHIGQSNFGRKIMAARFGHGPTKVVYITQQHGNEFIETEAAFNFLTRLGKTHHYTIQQLQHKISLLMIVRANPDGGEPDPERCQMSTPFPPPSSIDYDCAFYRFNIDPTAGTLPTQDEFRGALGVGYNLNRYHVSTLERPIRPVENQAMVGAILAFQPHYILDMHGDIPKVTCAIDDESITPVVPGLLYDSHCTSLDGSKINNISVRDMAEFIGNSDEKAQRWNAKTTKLLRFFGAQVGRHRQFNESVEIINTTGDYSQLTVDGEPIHTMLLEMRNLAPDADPFIAGMHFDQSPPTPKVDFALNNVLGQRNLFIGKIISEIVMMKGLTTIANGAIDHSDGDGGYHDIPEDTGFIYQFTDLTLQTLGLSNPGPYLFPLCTFEPCLTGSLAAE